MYFTNVKHIRKPVDGEKIYFINTFNVVDECIFEKGDPMLQKLVDSGNFFFSANEAQFEAYKTKYSRLYRKYIEQYGGWRNWSNEKVAKYYAYYDLTEDKIKIGLASTIKLQGVEYSDKKTIEEAVEFIDDGNFKKYLTDIREFDKLLDNIKDWGEEEDYDG